MATEAKTTQDFIPIKEVKDGILILKDGSMRAMVMTSSINFALKSEGEQEAILLQFQNFLNSLSFTIQIFVQSRRLDIRPYLSMLSARNKEQTDDLMKVQTREYIQFIKTFTDQTNIMTKTFFIVIPYAPPAINVSQDKLMTKIFSSKSAKDKPNPNKGFEEARTQIEQRVAIVQQGIVRTGVRAAQLGSEEVVEVFYQLFNPGDVERPINSN
jgi:type IV secretory pathway VirB4 component